MRLTYVFGMLSVSHITVEDFRLTLYNVALTLQYFGMEVFMVKSITARCPGPMAAKQAQITTPHHLV